MTATDNSTPASGSGPRIPRLVMLGLTGNIACGKSTVAGLLAKLGAAVIDADLLVRELYVDRNFARRVAALFEQPILTAEGTVDRAALRPLVLKDPAALRRLEALVHPAVAALRDQKLEALKDQAVKDQAQPPPVVVLEAVKLIESGQAEKCDVVWCVTCRPEIQLRRLMEKRGLSEDAARSLLARQPSFADKPVLLGALPFVVIENNASLEALERRVEEEWKEVIGSKTDN